MRHHWGILAVLAAACSRPDASSVAPPGSASVAPGPAPHYGEVMADVGRRFELTGRAAKAQRFALAGFELEEMIEAIDDDLPRAAPPREGDPAKLAALLDELRKMQIPAMQQAAKRSNGAAFATAFAASSRICNACHGATEHAFIEIPSEPGQAVPLLDAPADAAAAPPAPASTPASGSSASIIPPPIKVVPKPLPKPRPLPIAAPGY